VAEAIFAAPNNTHRFSDVAPTGVMVQRGPVMDGVGHYLKDDVPIADVPEADVSEVLATSRTDVLVSYLPVGSQRASEFYAARAIEAGCGYVNCIPVFIASNPDWRRRFEDAGLPIVGDDIKSQVGATILHRVLANLFRERGVRLDRTYQLNVGGNTDFKNMLERERLTSKKISKTQAVTSQFDVPMDADNIHVGPSDHVPWLTDRKLAFIRLEGTTFGGVPLSAEVKLEVWDSPNSAGVVIDAVRCAKLAMDRGQAGALTGPSSYFMKSPPQQFTDEEAGRRTRAFIDDKAYT
jgi:myo-inositol-1-phosphate synthase